MALFYAFAALLCLGSYMVPVRFSAAKGASFFPFMALGILVMDLLFLRGGLVNLAAHPMAFALALLSGLLWAGGQLMANAALERISLAKGTMLFSLNTFINILIGIIVFKEGSGPGALSLIAAGGLLLFAGAWLVSIAEPAEPKAENLRNGLPLALGAGLFWGAYFVPIKIAPLLDPASALPPLTFLSGLALGGCLPGFVLWPFQKGNGGAAKSLLAGFLSASLWVGGMAFFLLAIQFLGLSRAVPIVNANSLVYAAWSLLVFKEIRFSQAPKVLGGTLLALSGIILLARS